MTPKLKPCKTCKKQSYIFSKGDCKSCAQIRYNAKSIENKRSKAPKRISKTPTKKHTAAKAKELEAMQSVWSEHADIDDRCQCSECGKSLAFDRTHCAHILSKGAFPQYRANPENIIILCLNCHTTLDCDLKTEMDIWPYIQEKIFELKRAA